MAPSAEVTAFQRQSVVYFVLAMLSPAYMYCRRLEISGAIEKKSSSSDESSSENTEVDDTALVVDPKLEQNLRRLQEEERELLEKQAAMEAGTFDDIAALEHQDLLRLNHLQQRKVQKKQAAQAARIAQRLQQDAGPVEPEPRCENVPRRRATCTVRVNHLHAVEAFETDV